MVLDDPFVSIIVPTYNEADDIRRTLEALVGQAYPTKEIIVVDDSTDATPQIVQEYASRGVVLLRPPVHRGRSEARNLGIKAAKGDIIAILNSDVFPEPDFLTRIVAHYRRGADLVLVESEVANIDALFPRYWQALHRQLYGDQDWVEWSEGFSCRRAAALDVGLFPETPVPLSAGEDGYFGARLARKYRKVIDRSIVVPHVMPETMKGFWAQQLGRGRGSPRCLYFLYDWSLPGILTRTLAKTLRAIVTVGLVLPMVIFSLRLCRYSPRGLRDLPGFCAAFAISLLAHVNGEWLGLQDIWRYRHLSRRQRSALRME
jgi:glycosyltransferase involved in cell wall biosynthesis